MKKYLKTIEDIEALKDTDTIIHFGGDETFILKFVNGVLCSFYKENTDQVSTYNISLDIEFQTPYIEVEDEPSEDYIGKLGLFWDEFMEERKFFDVLASVGDETSFIYEAKSNGEKYHCFRPLTPEEVEKYTGYKVMEAG